MKTCRYYLGEQEILLCVIMKVGEFFINSWVFEYILINLLILGVHTWYAITFINIFQADFLFATVDNQFPQLMKEEVGLGVPFLSLTFRLMMSLEW